MIVYSPTGVRQYGMAVPVPSQLKPANRGQFISKLRTAVNGPVVIDGCTFNMQYLQHHVCSPHAVQLVQGIVVVSLPFSSHSTLLFHLRLQAAVLRR